MTESKKRDRDIEFDDAQGTTEATAAKRVRILKTHYTLANGAVLRRNLELSSIYHNHYEIEIKTLDDLLAIAAFYETEKGIKCRSSNIPFSSIYALKEPIEKLNAMVGLDEFKRQILDMILFSLQRFDEKQKDMLHTVVCGPPGCGKTTCVEILAEIYAALGILSVGKVISVKRSDLVGRFLGETAIKTRKVIESAFGSVLLIDEAYALGDTEQRDSFSKECIDTLNQFLSEHRGDFICILAGYEKDLEDRFFKSNPGLKRRFPFKVTIPPYGPKELRMIFSRLVGANDWSLVDGQELPVDWFDKEFPFAGGDMQTVFVLSKFAHSRRVFCAPRSEKKILTAADVKAGIDAFFMGKPDSKDRMDDQMMAMLYM